MACSLLDLDLNILYALLLNQTNEKLKNCDVKQCSSLLSGDPYEVTCGHELRSTIPKYNEEMRRVARHAKFQPSELYERCRHLANVRCTCRALEKLPISTTITEFRETDGAEWVFVWHKGRYAIFKLKRLNLVRTTMGEYCAQVQRELMSTLKQHSPNWKAFQSAVSVNLSPILEKFGVERTGSKLNSLLQSEAQDCVLHEIGRSVHMTIDQKETDRNETLTVKVKMNIYELVAMSDYTDMQLSKEWMCERVDLLQQQKAAQKQIRIWLYICTRNLRPDYMGVHWKDLDIDAIYSLSHTSIRNRLTKSFQRNTMEISSLVGFPRMLLDAPYGYTIRKTLETYDQTCETNMHHIFSGSCIC
jgi:hypothetical protein